jgi:hypothetical protein
VTGSYCPQHQEKHGAFQPKRGWPMIIDAHCHLEPAENPVETMIQVMAQMEQGIAEFGMRKKQIFSGNLLRLLG